MNTIPQQTQSTVDSTGTVSGEKMLVFQLGDQLFGISIHLVEDIINIQPITRVPNCPPYVMGVTNLRGKVIPIIDLRMRFGKDPAEWEKRACIIVVEIQENWVGLVVDKVLEVLSLSGMEDRVPSFQVREGHARFVQRVASTQRGTVLLLNCDAVIGVDTPSPGKPVPDGV